MKVVTDQQGSQCADVQGPALYFKLHLQTSSYILQTHTRILTLLTKTFVATLLLPQEYM